jgi:hypothetical protein
MINHEIVIVNYAFTELLKWLKIKKTGMAIRASLLCTIKDLVEIEYVFHCNQQIQTHLFEVQNSMEK